MNRYSKQNNAIRELRNRRFDYEAEITEINDKMNFVIDYKLTFENTIEMFNVREYITELETELGKPGMRITKQKSSS